MGLDACGLVTCNHSPLFTGYGNGSNIDLLHYYQDINRIILYVDDSPSFFYLL